MHRLDEKVLIVAGGGSGIGAATAQRLVQEGATVLVADLDGKAADRVALREGICDFTSDPSIPGPIGVGCATSGGSPRLRVRLR